MVKNVQRGPRKTVSRTTNHIRTRAPCDFWIIAKLKTQMIHWFRRFTAGDLERFGQPTKFEVIEMKELFVRLLVMTNNNSPRPQFYHSV